MSSRSVRTLVVLMLVGIALPVGRAAVAQEVRAGHYPQQTGADLYHSICQGCHMPDAQGAVGAGAYPALARDRHLRAAPYPVEVVIHGRKAMPGFGDALSDAQIASVVNYIRTRFGNHYKDAVTPALVKKLR